MSSILKHEIEYLKGVGPSRGELLKTELNVHKVADLLFLFPFRYIDKTQYTKITDISAEGEVVQIKGNLHSLEKIKGKNRRHRLTAILTDGTGSIDLVWFRGVKYLEESLKENVEYIAFGRVNLFNRKKSIPHPELEEVKKEGQLKSKYEPVYSSTEKLNARYLGSKGRRNLVSNILEKLKSDDIPEVLPTYLAEKMKLCSRYEAVRWIHFPTNEEQLKLAQWRLKFEELFFIQLDMLFNKSLRQQRLKGAIFPKIGERFNHFYHNILGFELTGAQKKVIKEIRIDVGSGIQMNRLLQGDVGSGKTIVALMTMLMALDNGFQTCLMVPTEILAHQHFQSISDMLKGTGISIGFLSGSVKGKQRKELLVLLENGDIDILIGTHALLEDPVVFRNLGIAIIDEQHRFGVAQRAKLWKKNKVVTPHILVMTATPIPRTLAMTYYGDLDVSVIDELPPGRKHIKTLHKKEIHRPKVIGFMKSEIQKGRQIYVVFPLIEESEKLDLQNLQDGYEQLTHFFRKPDYQVSVVHGRMKADDKEWEMRRFVEGKTHIMVATTVIEVGVNVPNASVMIIENTERFGLSQLHQLRGRVGRGAEQSYCILMSGSKLTKEARERIYTMVRTNNGFEIAEKDLELRGPGSITGLRQSGALNLQLANLITDGKILQTARNLARMIIDEDPLLKEKKNELLLSYLRKNRKTDWGRIS